MEPRLAPTAVHVWRAQLEALQSYTTHSYDLMLLKSRAASDMAALLGYHLQVLPEVCVGGAAVLKLLQVGLGTEQERVVKRARPPLKAALPYSRGGLRRRLPQ